ncbi:diaminopimelate decarboxylase [Rhodospirillaceae bacterium KN72]|uniref:Diaminopimelate decarboxylase n=1 Tax=Pacificispira spongiicola TaxID=2729598 RepID=A0A7Y0DXT2_9PROT|nr:diaminopimelate decarboxylase [Pacificispira spongiicola]NMM43572.1 diaminopimelate decarboxylase [Pacificispira spongiicola]
MNHFDYIDGVLHAESVPLPRIADEVGTPVYVYSAATLRRHYTVFVDAFRKAGVEPNVCFAVKANSNLAVIALLGSLGAGADVVSEGELRRALAAGIPPERIVFSGVGKTEGELRFALETGIHEINVESESEIRLLSKVADELGRDAEIAIRVNPDVDAKTHEKISTGRKENKFGIDIDKAEDIYALAASLPRITPVSVALHIGSQLTDLEPYRLAFRRMADLVERLRANGHPIRRVDLGGGLGIPYDAETPPLPDAYAQMAVEEVKHLNCEVMLEPGRMIVGNAGILLSRALVVKQGDAKRFLILDSAMNDLIRPALYNGHHGLRPVVEPAADAPYAPVDVVGPICESGDTFAKDRSLPPIEEGDLVAFSSAGAYGAVMASTYNSRLLVPEVLVDGDHYAVIRARQTYEEMLGLDSIPSWIGTEHGTDAERIEATG